MRHLSELEWLGWEVAAVRHLELTHATACVLRLLVQRAPAVARSDELVIAASRSLHGYGRVTTRDSIKVHVCYARNAIIKNALRDIGLPFHFENLRGIGYRLSQGQADRIFAAVETAARAGEPLSAMDSARRAPVKAAA